MGEMTQEKLYWNIGPLVLPAEVAYNKFLDKCSKCVDMYSHCEADCRSDLSDGCLVCSANKDCSEKEKDLCKPYANCLMSRCTEAKANPCKQSCIWDATGRRMCSQCNVENGMVVCNNEQECLPDYHQCGACASPQGIKCLTECRCGPEGYDYNGKNHANPQCNSGYCDGCATYRRCMRGCDSDLAKSCKEMNCVVDDSKPMSRECMVCLPYFHCEHYGSLSCMLEERVRCNTPATNCEGSQEMASTPPMPNECSYCSIFDQYCPTCVTDPDSRKCMANCRCGAAGQQYNQKEAPFPECKGDHCEGCDVRRGCMKDCSDNKAATCKNTIQKNCNDEAECWELWQIPIEVGGFTIDCLPYAHCASYGRRPCISRDESDEVIPATADISCAVECEVIGSLLSENYGLSDECVECMTYNSHCSGSCDSAIGKLCVSRCPCPQGICKGRCELCRPYAVCPRVVCTGSAAEISCSSICTECIVARLTGKTEPDSCSTCDDPHRCLQFTECFSELACSGTSLEMCSGICKYKSASCIACQAQEGAQCDDVCGSVSDCFKCRAALRHCDGCDSATHCMQSCACGPELQKYNGEQAPNAMCDTAICGACNENTRNCQVPCEEEPARTEGCITACRNKDPACVGPVCLPLYHCFTRGLSSCSEGSAWPEAVCSTDCYADTTVSSMTTIWPERPECPCLSTVSQPSCSDTPLCDRTTNLQTCYDACRVCIDPLGVDSTVSCLACNTECRQYWSCGEQKNECGLVRDTLRCQADCMATIDSNIELLKNSAECDVCHSHVACFDVCRLPAAVVAECMNGCEGCYNGAPLSECPTICNPNCKLRPAQCVGQTQVDKCAKPPAISCYAQCGNCLFESVEAPGCSNCPISCYKYSACVVVGHYGNCESTFGKNCIDNCVSNCPSINSCPSCLSATSDSCAANAKCLRCESYKTCDDCVKYSSCITSFHNDFYCRMDLITSADFKDNIATTCLPAAGCMIQSCENSPPLPQNCVIPEMNRYASTGGVATEKCVIDTTVIINTETPTPADVFRMHLEILYGEAVSLTVSNYATFCGGCWRPLKDHMATQGPLRCADFDEFIMKSANTGFNAICNDPLVLETESYLAGLEAIASVTPSCTVTVLPNVIASLADTQQTVDLAPLDVPQTDLVTSCNAALAVFQQQPMANFDDGCDCMEFLSIDKAFAESHYGPLSSSYCNYLIDDSASYAQACKFSANAKCVASGAEELAALLTQADPTRSWSSCLDIPKYRDFVDYPDQAPIMEAVCNACLFPAEKILDDKTYETYHQNLLHILTHACPSLTRKLETCPRWVNTAARTSTAATCFPPVLGALNTIFVAAGVEAQCRVVSQVALNEFHSLPQGDQLLSIQDYCTNCLTALPAGTLDPIQYGVDCPPFVGVLGRISSVCADYSKAEISNIRAVPTFDCANAKQLIEDSCPGFIDTTTGLLQLKAQTVARYCGNAECKIAVSSAVNLASQCTGESAVWGYVFDSLCLQSPKVTSGAISTGGEYCASSIFPEIKLDASTTSAQDCINACSVSACSSVGCNGDCEVACGTISGCVWYPEALPIGGLDMRCHYQYNNRASTKECSWCESTGNQLRLSFAQRVAAFDPVIASSLEELFNSFRRSCAKVGSSFCKAALQSSRSEITGEFDVTTACTDSGSCYRSLIKSSSNVLDTQCDTAVDPVACKAELALEVWMSTFKLFLFFLK